jgi:hypothetical protein
LTQEIWRFTRLDSADPDPNAYYIIPMILNDMGSGDPTWSESTVNTLTAILKYNRNIKDDFESLMKNPSTRQRAKKNTGPFRFWIPDDFDPTLLNSAITTIAQTSKGIFYSSLYVEAHDWLLENYLKLPVLNAKTMAPISKQWLEIKKFYPIFETYPQFKTDPLKFREKFWAGTYKISGEVDKHIRSNRFEFKLHLAKQKEHEQNLKETLAKEANRVIPTLLAPDTTYLNITKWAKDELKVGESFSKSVTMPIKDKWFKNKKVYKINQRFVYGLIKQAGLTAKTKDEWIENTLKLIQNSYISSYGIKSGTIEGLIKSDRYTVLSLDEFDTIQQMRKEIWLSSTRSANKKNNTGKTRPEHSKALKGRKCPDQSARMSGKNNPMFGKVHPNKGKTLTRVSKIK